MNNLYSVRLGNAPVSLKTVAYSRSKTKSAGCCGGGGNSKSFKDYNDYIASDDWKHKPRQPPRQPEENFLLGEFEMNLIKGMYHEGYWLYQKDIFDRIYFKIVEVEKTEKSNINS